MVLKVVGDHTGACGFAQVPTASSFRNCVAHNIRNLRPRKLQGGRFLTFCSRKVPGYRASFPASVPGSRHRVAILNVDKTLDRHITISNYEILAFKNGYFSAANKVQQSPKLMIRRQCRCYQ
jgi:hypothetical protein